MHICINRRVITGPSDGLLPNKMHSITIPASLFGEMLISFGQKVPYRRRWPWLKNYRARDPNLTNTNSVASKLKGFSSFTVVFSRILAPSTVLMRVVIYWTCKWFQPGGIDERRTLLSNFEYQIHLAKSWCFEWFQWNTLSVIYAWVSIH